MSRALVGLTAGAGSAPKQHQNQSHSPRVQVPYYSTYIAPLKAEVYSISLHGPLGIGKLTGRHD